MNKIKFIALTILCIANIIGCSNTDNNKRITLIEAYQRLEENALDWSSDAELVKFSRLIQRAILMEKDYIGMQSFIQ